MEIHLIGNAHLDPVWLWDWRDGLNEGIATVQTILDLMEEFPELTFTRGEAVIYQHIEKTDPKLFERIRQMVEAKRWEVVGGTYLQPDTNLASLETLARHFTTGQRYFLSRFGQSPRVAWQADSFGHSAGLPEVFAAAGIRFFAFTRPDSKRFPMPEPAFWWEGQGGARILAYRPLVGWYGTERDEMGRKLDALVKAAKTSRLETIGCFYGMGNHGGGPCRKQLRDINQWARQHPEVRVVYSGLHRFFDTLAREVAHLPSHRGELNFCLRGCYSSGARLKFLYRQSEAAVVRAETTDTLIAAQQGRRGTDLSGPWEGLLFNSFHDILPGTSIERALEEQIRWLGGVVHSAQKAEFGALNELARLVDTTVRPAKGDHPTGVSTLVWNPHPHAFHGHVELETCIDYRPCLAYQDRADQVPLRVLGANGKPLPFQEIAPESDFAAHIPWRKRVLVPVSLPAWGWNVLEMGWVEGAKKIASKSRLRSGAHWIDNGLCRIEARLGSTGVRLLHHGKSVFGNKGLGVFLVEDPWGCWGDLEESPESLLLKQVREKWKITAVKAVESGPERVRLWIRFSGSRSHLDLSLSLYRDKEQVEASARLLWNERNARLKLQFPFRGEAEFAVPGAVLTRSESGEMPGGRWVRIHSDKRVLGFASDALYNFSRENGELQATVVRATRYADEKKSDGTDLPWRPVLDAGEFQFRFLLDLGDADLANLARQLEQPPVALTVAPNPGPLPRAGSLGALQPASLQLLALKPAEEGDGFVLRAQTQEIGAAHLLWMGKKIPLGEIQKGKILSWKLQKTRAGWKAHRVDLMECREPSRPEKRKSRQHGAK